MVYITTMHSFNWCYQRVTTSLKAFQYTTSLLFLPRCHGPSHISWIYTACLYCCVHTRRSGNSIECLREVGQNSAQALKLKKVECSHLLSGSNSWSNKFRWFYATVFNNRNPTNSSYAFASPEACVGLRWKSFLFRGHPVQRRVQFRQHHALLYFTRPGDRFLFGMTSVTGYVGPVAWLSLAVTHPLTGHRFDAA